MMPVDSGMVALNFRWVLEQIGCLSTMFLLVGALALFVLFVKVNYTITKKEYEPKEKWRP